MNYLSKKDIGILWTKAVNVVCEFERFRVMANLPPLRQICPSEKIRTYCETILENFENKNGKGKLVRCCFTKSKKLGLVSRE